MTYETILCDHRGDYTVITLNRPERMNAFTVPMHKELRDALDKAVGKCLLENRSLRERGAMLSGRISLEMLAKAAQAGLELVAGVSAPTSLAIDVAQRLGITLCGFVRDDRATVYTRPHRIQN